MRERKIPQCTTKRKRTAGDLIRDFVCVRMRVCVAHEQLKRIREKSINIKSRYIVISENLIWNLSQLSQFSRAKQTERVSCCCCCRLTLIFYWSIQSIGMCARFCSRLFMLSLSHLLPSQFRILYRWFSLAFGSRHTKSPIPLYRIDMANTWQAHVFFPSTLWKLLWFHSQSMWSFVWQPQCILIYWMNDNNSNNKTAPLKQAANRSAVLTKYNTHKKTNSLGSALGFGREFQKQTLISAVNFFSLLHVPFSISYSNSLWCCFCSVRLVFIINELRQLLVLTLKIRKTLTKQH